MEGFPVLALKVVRFLACRGQMFFSDQALVSIFFLSSKEHWSLNGTLSTSFRSSFVSNDRMRSEWQNPSFQGHFERNDDQTRSHFSSLISVIRGHSDLEWPSNDKIPSFRSHSGMTWDELPFARKISRLLGRAMEGPKNDVEWCRNDVGMMEWQPDDWNDYRMIKYEQGGG